MKPIENVMLDRLAQYSDKIATLNARVAEAEGILSDVSMYIEDEAPLGTTANRLGGRIHNYFDRAATLNKENQNEKAKDKA